MPCHSAKGPPQALNKLINTKTSIGNRIYKFVILSLSTMNQILNKAYNVDWWFDSR